MTLIESELKISIVWGVDQDYIEEYFFDNEKEMTAFTQGVEASEGWHKHTIIGKGYDFKTVEEWEKHNDKN